MKNSKLSACLPVVSDYDNFRHLIFGSKSEGSIKVLFVPKNKLHASKLRLIRKLKYSCPYFKWWLTFTFAEKKADYQVNFMKFTTTETLESITEFGLSAYMRYLFNLLRMNLKKLETKLKKAMLYPDLYLSYFWIYEQGTINNRPHFHACISDIGIPSDGKYELPVRRYLFKRWKAGNVEAELLNSSQDKLSAYLEKYIEKEHHESERFTGKRFWSTSRDVRVPPKDPDIVYLGYANDFSIATHYRLKLIKIYRELGTWDFYMDYSEVLAELSAWFGVSQTKITDFIDDYAERELPYEAFLDYIDGFGRVRPSETLIRNQENLKFK